MLIKLMPDQVSLFWSLIKHGVIQSYKIPKEFQQDFTLKYLENLLAGNYQCWIIYNLDEEESKRLIGILCTKIVDSSEYGVRTLMFIGIYGLRMITDDVIDDAVKSLGEFAKANNCSVMSTEYRTKRIEDILTRMGFEKHTTISRKFLT